MMILRKASTILIALVVAFSFNLPFNGNAHASGSPSVNNFVTATSAEDLVNHFIAGSSISLVSGSETIKGPLENTSKFSQLDAGTLNDGTPLTLNQGVFIKAEALGANGDTDLQAVLTSANKNSTVTNVSAFEFQFTVPKGMTSVALNFIFASQEGYNSDWDIAGVFVDGINYALLPNGSILRVTADANLNNFPSVAIPSWGAWSPPQKMVGLLDPNVQTHKIKIAVANTGDSSVPSGLFVSGLTPGTATKGGVVSGSSISPEMGTFDKYMINTEAGYYHDFVTTLDLNGKTLSDVQLNGVSIGASAYTVSDNLVTFHKEYLSTLELGVQVFTFEMSSGENPILTLTVSNTTPPLLESVIGGDGQATLVWSPVNGSTGYKVYQSVTSGTYGYEVATVTDSVYSQTITGLTNGSEYYFVVKAVNVGGNSAASNQLSAIPQVNAPDAPMIQSVIPGNSQVSLTWTPVDGSTGYKVYQSVTSGTYGEELTTVTGSVYDYTSTGLTNGTKYYFVVKAINAGGESAASNSVTATPVTIPGAPTDVKAVRGNSEVTVSFNPPTDDGGSAIIGYKVTASPGQISSTGSASPVIVSGLSNGTEYTFTVQAINLVGSSVESSVSNSATPMATAESSNTGADVLVNGKLVNTGVLTSLTLNGQTVTTMVVDQQKLEQQLASEGNGAVVIIPINAKSDVAIAQLTGQMIKNMEKKDVVLQIKTENATYSLPAKQINIDSISNQLGQTIGLGDIKVQIEISTPKADMLKIVENAAAKENFTLLSSPLNFTIKGIYGDSTIEISKFNGYVERTIAIPEGVDLKQITTGIVIEPDGTIRHVPTQIVTQDGASVAKINSLTNSTYAVVSHPLVFKDVEQHWAQAAVNDMGSRMIINGVGEDLFNPDQDITRAEFAAIVVKGLGLKLVNNGTIFSDVVASDWYSAAVQTASEYKLINGFADGSFHPMDKLTREQAMTIIAKAVVITQLQEKLPAYSTEAVLNSFADVNDMSTWAKNSIAECLQAGLITGRSGVQMELAPKASMTRAEVAVIVQRLLQKSELI